MVREILEFENFSIDTEAFELRLHGAPVAVEPLVLDLIVDLARQPGILRTREDLIETVWKGRIVSDTTISTAIKTARKVLQDTDTDKRLIRTVRGRGFQFAAEVTARQNRDDAKPAQAAPLPLLRIQVAPIDNSISPSMTRALEGRLRTIFDRIPFLNIAVPASAVSEIAATGPDATHLIEIALSSLDETLHADVSLYDLRGGLQKWARHFSTPSRDGVGKLLTEIAPKAEPQLLREASELLSKERNDEPKALVLQAMQIISDRGWNPCSIATASSLLERATSEDQSLSIAHALISLLNALGHRVGMLRHDNSAVTRAIESAERALSLDGQNSAVLGLAGCALCDVGQLVRGEPIIDRALDLDPMNGHAYAAKGAALMMRGEYDDALTALRKSIEISPADSRLAVWGAVLAGAELRCGLVEAARRSVELAVSRDDVNYLPRLAAVAVHLARDDARASESALIELLRVHPDITSNEILFFVGKRSTEVIWPLIEAMRQALKQPR